MKEDLWLPNNGKITDKGIMNLQNMRINLNICGSLITNEGLRYLSGMIRGLNVSYCQKITDSGIM